MAKELYCYHQTVAQRLKPLLFSEHHEDFDNATLTSNEDKEQIVGAWSMVVEVYILWIHPFRIQWRRGAKFFTASGKVMLVNRKKNG